MVSAIVMPTKVILLKAFETRSGDHVSGLVIAPFDRNSVGARRTRQ